MNKLETRIYKEFRERTDGFVGNPDDHVSLGEKTKNELAVKYDMTFMEVNDILSKGYLTEIYDAFFKDKEED